VPLHKRHRVDEPVLSPKEEEEEEQEQEQELLQPFHDYDTGLHVGISMSLKS